jgi:hypothetical protein
MPFIMKLIGTILIAYFSVNSLGRQETLSVTTATLVIIAPSPHLSLCQLLLRIGDIKAEPDCTGPGMCAYYRRKIGDVELKTIELS